MVEEIQNIILKNLTFKLDLKRSKNRQSSIGGEGILSSYVEVRKQRKHLRSDGNPTLVESVISVRVIK